MSEKQYMNITDDTIIETPKLISMLEKKIVEQQATIEQLRTQLLICQQSKSDNGRFQVWEVPPIPEGKRISFTTNNDGGDSVWHKDFSQK